MQNVRRNAAQEREKFLQELKERLALRISSKATDVNAVIRTIDCQLDNGRRFHRIANAVWPTSSVAFTKLEIVKTETHLNPRTGCALESKTIKIVDTRRALKEAIIKRNKAHFAQADGTPFTQESLCRIRSTNGYSVYHDADGYEIRVQKDSFLETKTLMDLLRERHQNPAARW
jgi:hypothetical protein